MSDERDRVRVNWTDAERTSYTTLALILILWLVMALSFTIMDGPSPWIMVTFFLPVVLPFGWAAWQTSRLAVSADPVAASRRAAVVVRLPGVLVMFGLGAWMLMRHDTVEGLADGVVFLAVGVWQLAAILRRRRRPGA